MARRSGRVLCAALVSALPLFSVACGVAVDRSVDPGKARRAAAMADDPRARPGIRERREARGAAMQEWETLANGGLPLYKGDGSSSNINAVHFAAAPGALTLDCYASERLNGSGGAPHALRLVVYHLKDRAAFDQLARHPEGIRKLLEGEWFDDSVAGVRVHEAQPGMRGRLLGDRYDGGRYVALVAGYGGELRARSAVFVTEYRLYEWRMEGGTAFSRDRSMYSPYPLHLRVVLDESEMRVEDTDRMLNRMGEVTNLGRRQMHALLRPSFRSDAARYAGM